LQQTVEQAQQATDPLKNAIIVVGDFNSKNSIWCSTDKTDTAGRELKKVIDDTHLLQLVDEPTRIVRFSTSRIDLIFTDSPGFIISHNVLPPIGNSDHSTLLLKLHIKCRNKSV